MDIFAFQDDVFCSLVERANRYFKEKGMATIQCWIPYHHRYVKLLRKSGFFSYRWLARFCLGWLHLGIMKGAFHPLIVYVIPHEGSETEVDFLSERNWFVTMGDPH